VPRKGPAVRRELMPDPVYRSVLVTQVVNKVLSRGKRTLAERIVYGALEDVAEKTGNDPVAVLKKAVENVRPELEVRSRRVGGARSPSRSVPGAPPRWPSVGWSASPSSAGRRPWPSGSPTRSAMPPTASAPR